MGNDFWMRIESKANRNFNNGDRCCAGIRRGMVELAGARSKQGMLDFKAGCVKAHGGVVDAVKDRMSCSISVLSSGAADTRFMAKALAEADNLVYDMVWTEVKRTTTAVATINNLGAAFPGA